MQKNTVHMWPNGENYLNEGLQRSKIILAERVFILMLPTLSLQHTVVFHLSLWVLYPHWCLAHLVKHLNMLYEESDSSIWYTEQLGYFERLKCCHDVVNSPSWQVDNLNRWRAFYLLHFCVFPSCHALKREITLGTKGEQRNKYQQFYDCSHFSHCSIYINLCLTSVFRRCTWKSCFRSVQVVWQMVCCIKQITVSFKGDAWSFSQTIKSVKHIEKDKACCPWPFQGLCFLPGFGNCQTQTSPRSLFTKILYILTYARY